MTFFTEVGKAVCAQLGHRPHRRPHAHRAQFAPFAPPLWPRMACPNSLRPRGGYDQEDPDKGGGGGYAFGSGPGDPNGSAEPPDPNELMQFVRLLANKLSDRPTMHEFMMQLAGAGRSQEGSRERRLWQRHGQGQFCRR